MTRYEGLPCTYCGEKFEKDSDVVVCPSCGAPYHRDCFKKEGKCKYEDKHKEGYTWSIPVEDLPPERITVCLKCQTPNPKENTFCQNCHARLSDAVRVISVTKKDLEEGSSLSPDGEVLQGEGEGISTSEVAAYTGKKSFYFIQRFRLMAAGKAKFFWNWPAFFFKYLYFYYRRMYLVGFIAILIYAMLAIPSVMYSAELLKMNAPELFGVTIEYNAALLKNLESFMPTINFLNILYSVGCGLFANKLYMKKVFKDIRNVRQKVTGRMNQKQYLETLSKVGKTDKLTVILLIFGFLVLYFKFVSDLAASMLL